MATRKQKRARRMRAKQHQKELVGRTRRTVYDDGTEIDHPVGRRPRADHYRRTDPPKHGNRLDARGQLIKDLREVGIEDPNDDMIREYSRLLKRSGGNRAVAKSALAKNLEKVMGAASVKPAIHPTPDKWEDIVAHSKRRKRGVTKIAQKAGFKLVTDDADPKKRESWVEA